MSICIVSPRFYPVIGGNENYFLNIVNAISNSFTTMVITSNLKNLPINIFDKPIYIRKTYDLINNNTEIIRVNTLKNSILKTIFFFNQFLNKKLEIISDEYLNPQLYLKNKENRRNQQLKNLISKIFINQRKFSNPNFSQIYHILKKVYFEKKFNLIHSAPVYLNSNIYAFRFAMKYNVPFIIKPIYHINPYADYIFYPSYQYILKKSDIVIAETDVEKKFYMKYGISKKKIKTIAPGIDPEKYKKKPDIAKFKQKYKIQENEQLLFFLGRRTFEKGIPQTIYALKFLINKYVNIKLMIAGPTTREFELFFKSIPKKLKTHIIDLGFIDEATKQEALASCDIFLLPSLDDAFGVVYLEAWLYKKPVIAALEGNVAGVIDDEINGFLVPFKNIKKLANCIDKLLSDNVIRNKFGQNGYDKVYSKYLIRFFNEKMMKLYNEFI